MSRLAACGLFVLRLWCVVAWVFFMPFVTVRALYSLMHALGAVA
jgi:hypothetical protein